MVVLSIIKLLSFGTSGEALKGVGLVLTEDEETQLINSFDPISKRLLHTDFLTDKG